MTAILRHPRSAPPIRVLVVDDSFFMRTLIADVLAADEEIQVLATASSGSQGLQKARELRPDCVVLDLSMPGLDGLRTLRILMAVCPTPVVVLSAHSQPGADITARCLAAGAAGFIPKPSGEVSLDIDLVAERLVAVVKDAARSGANVADRQMLRALRAQELIVVGASTGGQPTLHEFVRTLFDADLPPILIVQHAPSRPLTEQFAERLNRSSSAPVKVAEHNEPLAPGVVYVAPGGSVVTVRRKSEMLTRAHALGVTIQAAPGQPLTPSIDVAMRSAASACRNRLIGIILSGIGNDGVEGMRAIKAAGGRTIVQDQSALLFGLPQAVIEARLADHVLPASEIATQIQRVA